MRFALLIMFMGLSLIMWGCGDDGGSSETDGGTDSDTDSDGDTDSTGDAGTGDFCDENVDCETGFCETYQNVPMDPDGYCTEGPPLGEIRILGNVRDYYTDEYQVGVDVEVCGAIAVMMDPANAPAVVTGTSDEDGKYAIDAGEEATSQSVGLVARVTGEGYYLTVTGLVEPELGEGQYPPGVRNHDVKMMPQSMLDEWSGYITDFDSGLSGYVPLGDNGGAIGSLRHVENGEGVAGATLVSQLDTSTAIILYLNEDMDGFNDVETSSNGMFVILEPALAEKFDAWKDDEIISRLAGTFGETFGAIYSNTVHVEGYAD